MKNANMIQLTARESALFVLFATEQPNSCYTEEVQAASVEDDAAFGGLTSNLVQKGLLTIEIDDDPYNDYSGMSLFRLTDAGHDLAATQDIFTVRD